MPAWEHLGGQFDPEDLEIGAEVSLPRTALMHPKIIRDERDPRRGGVGAGLNQRGADAVFPEFGIKVPEGSYLDTDKYIDLLGQHMKTYGQRLPLLLQRQPSGRFWLGEGNHRLAAARRVELPTLIVKRQHDSPWEINR